MNDLDLRLRELGDAVPAPHVPLAEDLARGRAGVRRQRLTVTGAALATAAVVVGGWALVPDGTGPSSHGEAEVAGASGRTTSAPTAAEDPLDETGTDGPSPEPVKPQYLPGIPDEQPPSLGAEKKHVRAWGEVLADHLDPDRQHLQAINGVQLAESPSGLYMIGTTAGWGNAGEAGLGSVEVAIARAGSHQPVESPCSWDQLDCTEAPAPPEAESLLVGRAGGVVAVVVERRSGERVAVTFDPLWGNNSLVATSAPGPTVEEMVDVALDERISLP